MSTSTTQNTDALNGARVIVGVSGGIAAYKAAHIVRGLVACGADVRVIPTPSSREFVGAATWEALSHNPVRVSVFEDVEKVAHVRHGQEADLVLVAPATADLLARARMGRADDLLTASLLVTRAPVVMAPAMHTEMWENPATQENVAVLRDRGMIILEPDSGRLTGPDSGPGRLPEPDAIVAAARSALVASRRASTRMQESGSTTGSPTVRANVADVADLNGVRVLITAGGTREEIDPVRYIGNHSSGKQGWALAHAAAIRGAHVTLLAANVSLPTPPGVRRIDVTSAAELAEAVAEHRDCHDVLMMAAAVADFTPSHRSGVKIKKESHDDVPEITLVRTLDILADAAHHRDASTHSGPAVIVGFAAETGDDGASSENTAQAVRTAKELAQEKARRKGADLLVFNDVSAGVFGADDNHVIILDRDGHDVSSASGHKIDVAHAIVDEVRNLVRA